MAESLVERSVVQSDGSIMLPFYLEQGKFIRIHFGPSGKLAGADIETCEYLIRHILKEKIHRLISISKIKSSRGC